MRPAILVTYRPAAPSSSSIAEAMMARYMRSKHGRCLAGSLAVGSELRAICDYVHDRIEFG